MNWAKSFLRRSNYNLFASVNVTNAIRHGYFVLRFKWLYRAVKKIENEKCTVAKKKNISKLRVLA